MMTRLLLPGYLFLLLCICIAIPANAQDSLKKAEAVKKAVVPPKPRPYNHYRKVGPVATTPTVVTPAVTPSASPKHDTTNSLKTQIDPAQLNDKSLNGQYQYLLSKTYHYQQPLITALWKNMRDTLNMQKRQLQEAQAKLSTQNKALDTLKADVNSKEQTLTESNAKVDSISLFGLAMPKATYNLVMFGLVIGLAIALVIVVATTAKYKHEARHRIELYEEIDEEYKAFKAKANEKEKKLARELQTERNKLDELLGRG